MEQQQQKIIDDIKARLAALTDQEPKDGQLDSEHQPPEPDPTHSDLWAFYVQMQLGTIMDERAPLARRLTTARSVLGRFKRECYEPNYELTTEDRQILTEAIGQIKTASKGDGTVVRWIPGDDVWVP